jgi:hypothetical protein
MIILETNHHDIVAKQFRKENSTVSKRRSFSQIALDQAHKQNNAEGD